MEAMSYGLPCIASNVGGVPSLIQDGQNGILIPPKDLLGLILGLEKLVHDGELRNRLGLSARKRIEAEFTWERHANEMFTLYRSLIKR